jgi:hypothetical protein
MKTLDHGPEKCCSCVPEIESLLQAERERAEAALKEARSLILQVQAGREIEDAYRERIAALEAALTKIVKCHGEDECGFCGSMRIAKEALSLPAPQKEGCKHDMGDKWLLGMETLGEYATKENYLVCPFCPPKAPASERAEEPKVYTHTQMKSLIEMAVQQATKDAALPLGMEKRECPICGGDGKFMTNGNQDCCSLCNGHGFVWVKAKGAA